MLGNAPQSIHYRTSRPVGFLAPVIAYPLMAATQMAANAAPAAIFGAAATGGGIIGGISSFFSGLFGGVRDVADAVLVPAATLVSGLGGSAQAVLGQARGTAHRTMTAAETVLQSFNTETVAVRDTATRPILIPFTQNQPATGAPSGLLLPAAIIGAALLLFRK